MKTKDLVTYRLDRDEKNIQLDANESFIAYSPEMEEKLRQVFEETPLNRYPDPRAQDLCQAFANRYGIQPEWVSAGNGSDEMIHLVMACFLNQGDVLLTLDPDFSMYRKAAQRYGVQVETLEKEEDFRIDVAKLLAYAEQKKADMLIFSNPCNPTGRVLDQKSVRELIDGFSGFVVVDEAYMEFADESVLGDVGQRDKLIVLRTLSKAYGAAGLRVGFAIASEALTEQLQKGKDPYNVGVLSQGIAKAILEEGHEIDQAIGSLKEGTSYLYEALSELASEADLRVYPTRTNFILITSPEGEKVYQGLKEVGISIRKIDETHLRVCTGNPEENQRLIQALKQILKEKKA